jgi:hypothetical protein
LLVTFMGPGMPVLPEAKMKAQQTQVIWNHNQNSTNSKPQATCFSIINFEHMISDYKCMLHQYKSVRKDVPLDSM